MYYNIACCWFIYTLLSFQMRNVYIFLIRSPEQKRPVLRPLCQWEDNVKVGLVGRGNVDWILLTRDVNQRQVFFNAVMNLCFQLKTDLH